MSITSSSTLTAAQPKRRSRPGWLVPAGLIVLALIPVVMGSLRLVELGGGAATLPNNPRADASPLPIVIHIVSVTVFSVLGAMQFAPGLRRRPARWHRIAGRVLVFPAGILAAGSALWMTVFYAHPEGTGELLVVFRLILGSAMLASLVLGLLAIRKRAIMTHRAWMTRAYAIGLGAGTQVFTLTIGPLVLGPLTETTTALMHLAGWVINLAVAEWAIRRRLTSPATARARGRVAAR
ncbi:DUF2306 domain-containing protein [Salinibacterium sp. ZJ450]|uniref:DUF2306 domain-containing protein n=1 Tax=Salinibacterium sp. ZJ450 TaxID=2708338 RepID=UPI00141DDC64|nr:DUF2306 domain-containing protein [Salinibacterium sp. ZJ450]